MSRFPDGWRRFTAIWRRGAARDVDSELDFHFAERTAELVATGMTAGAAHDQALREFGDVAATRSGLVAIDRRIHRQRVRAEWLGWLRQDFGYVLRTLARSPGFVCTVAITLALGIGVNTAIFSVLDRLFLAPPPGIAHPGQVRRIFRFDPPKAPTGPVPHGCCDAVIPKFDYPDFDQLRRTLPASIPLGGYDVESVAVGSGGGSESLGAEYLLGDYFRVLGVQPVRGRFFTSDELRVEVPRQVVVISEGLWRRRFAANPSIVGTTVAIEGHLHTIIGVTPAGFHGADNDAADLWLPMNDESWLTGQGKWYEGTHTYWIQILALAPDQFVASKLGAAATIAFRHDTRFHDSLAVAQIRPIVPASSTQVNPQEMAIATRLGAVALIILLIGCANVAGLFMVRTAERRREIAVRLALGISRRRLGMLIFLEAFVVATIAGAVALLTAIWSGAALRHLLLPDTRFVDPAVNLHVVEFAVGAMLVAAVLAAGAPVRQSGRIDLSGGLRGGVRGRVASSALRRFLLTAQVALSTVLVVAATVFVRSFHSVETAPIGYDIGQIAFVNLRPDPAHPEQRSVIDRRLPDVARQVATFPGIERVALAAQTPMRGISFLDLRIPGRDTAGIYSAAGPSVSYVSPEFFATMGMRVLTGRGLDAADRSSTSAVVINHAMAQHFWPNESAVGKCLEIGDAKAACSTIVGVVSNAHAMGLIETVDAEQFYLPLTDTPATVGPASSAGMIIVRAAPGRAAQVTAMLQRRLGATVGAWATPDVHPMTQNVASELRPWRTGAELFSATGLLALLVALVGIYSTVSYHITQRTHEIGVRMALGAQSSSIVGRMLRHGVRDVLAGLAIGIVLSLALARVVQAMVYHTSPHDPLVLVVAVSVLALGAAVASLVPAWRVIQVDPVKALRTE